jgi:hypothetical protein
MSSRILFLFVALTFGLFAVEGTISVYPVDKEYRFVSEEVVLKVDLKTTAFSITNAKIGLENSKDYVVLAPKSAASLETVEMNDTNWQVVHYEYKLYPLHAGKITIAPIDIAFRASMGYGQPENNFTFQSDAFILDVRAPKGVGKEDFVLSTPSYSLKSNISPKLSETNVIKIKVGDAIEIKVIQEAKNVPDILLKPIHFSEDPHLKIYKEEPILKSKEVGIETIATRTDSFTFVAAKEGNVSIPSQKLIWWNPAEEVLHMEKTPSLHFIVLPNPKSAASLTPSEEEEEDKPSVLSILLILILIGVLYKLIPYIQKKKVEKKVAYMQSEEGRFKTLLDSCQRSDVATLYHDFYYWLEVADPKFARVGFRGISKVQPSFSKALSELELVLAVPEQVFDKAGFINELKKFRERLMKEKQDREQRLPEGINPI